jgi:hypothetical protein
VIAKRLYWKAGGHGGALGEGGVAAAKSAPIDNQLAPGQTASQTISLAPGKWELSLQYVSPVALSAHAAGTKLRAAASLEGPGAFWRVGAFTSRGRRTRIVIGPRDAPTLEAFRSVLVGSLAVTAAGDEVRTVPLASACGRYVDWYQSR